MHPIVGTIPYTGITVSSYMAARWLYLALAVVLTVKLNARQGIGASRTLGAFLVGIPAGLIGAHLLNVVEDLPFYRQHPWRTFDVLTGGSSIYGGFVMGTGAGVAYMIWQGLALRRFLDAAAPAMALGAGVTRIGCFLNGCCFGRPTSSVLGVVFPRTSHVFTAQVWAGLVSYSDRAPLPVHPVQLYAAGFNVLLCGVLIYLFVRGRGSPGQIFCLFVVAYGLSRFALSFLRADAVLYWWETSRLWSIGAGALGLGLWWAWRDAAARTPGHAGRG